ncbi:peroxiredoxin [Methylacidimicrobium tartarophylax]|uniref:Alkyl hydroperoxide reductase C n=1 Tax=Methylacidimicrobium tartarophylax TaxID=1041768 RepID=A0A5E6M694_9BACT|nr:peroxiredoxin [Methylacidimicrobium tartarophylax]VVM04876.1 cytosolic tryparedoxin peroxidase, trypanosomatid typical 2-Cys peroxiredoxin [Methylacidimicrobium tartarophylax]
MLTVGDHLPKFTLKAVQGGPEGLKFDTAFTDISDETHGSKWKVIFFWPKDFTFVCPTELVGFGERIKEFTDRHAVLYGASTDSEFVHLNWRLHHPSLKGLPFPMLADIKRELSTALGILHKTEGVALRATFIVDPHNVIRFVSVNDLSVGRNPAEVLRVLDALQSGELCPCDWQKGEEFLTPAAV